VKKFENLSTTPISQCNKKKYSTFRSVKKQMIIDYLVATMPIVE